MGTCTDSGTPALCLVEIRIQTSGRGSDWHGAFLCLKPSTVTHALSRGTACWDNCNDLKKNTSHICTLTSKRLVKIALEVFLKVF